MGKHFAWKVENGNFTFSRKEDEIARERALDGIYVVREGTPDAYQSRVFELLAADELQHGDDDVHRHPRVSHLPNIVCLSACHNNSLV